MKEESPIEPLFKQISELINLAKEKSSEPLEGDVTPDIMERLKVVENLVNGLSKVVQEELDEKGITNDELVRRIFHEKEKFTPRYRKDLDRAMELSREALGLRYALEMARINNTRPSAKDQRAKDKKAKDTAINKRKGKFKKNMGDQQWKKL